MADTYLHGAYGNLGESITQRVTASATVPVYFGTAPVGLVRGYGELDVVNVPVRISSLADARAKVGYSTDFGSFTLCEAIAAHFDSGADGVGPIYVVNVLDPAVHKSAAATEKAVSFVAGRAEVATDTAVVDTVAVKDSAGSTTYAEGTDYTLDYNATAGKIVLTAVEGGQIEDGEAKVTYTEMDPDAVDKDDVIGAVSSDGEYSGIQALALLWQEQGVVPNLLAAPGWSQEPDVYRALVTASQSVNGHWQAFVAADLPLVDPSDGSTLVDTIAKATKWKADNVYSSERSVSCWPMAEDAYGRRFHVSTLFCAASQRVDQSHDGVPFESPSNKEVPVTRQFFGDNAKNRGFDQQSGNGLNESGIVTVVGWAGAWVLWGPHTSAYSFAGSTADPRSNFAPTMRTLFHIANSFQLDWALSIDAPMTRALKDRIVNAEQEKLDRLVTLGALVGEPRVSFEEEENPSSEILQGNFRWSEIVTVTPPLKSATMEVSYTDEGFSAYFEDGGEA